MQYRSVVYGRLGGNIKTVCSGQRNTGPATECISTDVAVLDHVKGFCQGSMSCAVPVGGHLADLRNAII